MALITETIPAVLDASPARARREDRRRDRRLVAGQWQLIWLRFRKHKLGLAGGIAALLIYLIALFAEFLAPSTLEAYAPTYRLAPPMPIEFIHTRADGSWELLLHTHPLVPSIDKAAMRRTLAPDLTKTVPLGFLVQGEPYRFWGLFPTNIHFFGAADGKTPVYFLGGDRLGRDLLSRIIYGARISLSIGLAGVAISFLFGVIIGGVSGYFGGWTDNLIQRVVEILDSIPTVPLWIGLAAVIPLSLAPELVYFLITLILALISWTGLARVVRGRFLALKTEDYIVAARLDGASPLRIIVRHMVPSFTSHIIAALSLAIPGMILAETALSYLGIGLRPPVVSWGVLLQDGQNIRTITEAPWLLLPGVAVIVTVLALNFLGDGLRDAADPYAQ